MSRFSNFLIEAAITPVDLKNLQGSLLSIGSKQYFDSILETLIKIEPLFVGYSKKAAKDDYKPSGKNIIFGKDPTTKQWFVGYNLSKICYSNKDILDQYGGSNAEILKYALRFLPDLNIGGIIEVSILFIKPDVKVEKDQLIFTDPNKIKHIIPKQTNLFEIIKNCQIGIQVISKYEGSDIRSLSKHPTFIPNIKSIRNIWIAPTSFKDHSGHISLTQAESEEFKKLINELISLRKTLPTPFLGQGKALQLFKSMEEFNKTSSVPTTPNAYIVGLVNWAKNQHINKISKDNSNLRDIKTTVEDMVTFINRNQVQYRIFLNIYFTLGKIQEIISKRIDIIQKLEKDSFIVSDKTDGHIRYADRNTYQF